MMIPLCLSQIYGMDRETDRTLRWLDSLILASGYTMKRPPDGSWSDLQSVSSVSGTHSDNFANNRDAIVIYP